MCRLLLLEKHPYRRMLMCIYSFSSEVASPVQARKGERKIHPSKEKAGVGTWFQEVMLWEAF